MVKRRHVFYVGGYDAQGAEGYYRLFVRESKRFLKVWPIELHVGDLKIDSDDLAYWNIEAAGLNWQVAIRYEFLRLEHFLRANLAQPLTRQLARAAWWAVDDLITGALWRISRSSWRFALHLAYLQLMLVLWIAMAAAGGSLAAVLTMHFVNLPTPITAVITLVAGVAILMLLRPLADRWFILQVANCWPYVREFARGKPTGYDRPIDILAARIVAAASANEADELVVIGHSSGGAIGAAVVARALEFDSDLFQHRPRLVLMTLGSLLPALTLHPAAHRLRGAVRRLAMERSLVWVDCQSRKDWLNLWGVDPSAVSRIANARFIEAEEVRGILWRYTPPEIAAGKMYSDYLAEVTPAGQTDWQ